MSWRDYSKRLPDHVDQTPQVAGQRWKRLGEVGRFAVLGAITCIAVAQSAQPFRLSNSVQTADVSPARQQFSRSLDIAEKKLTEATASRNKLTGRALQTAIRLLADSALRFSNLGVRQKAALAELEIGDTYQMMSRYHDALAAYNRSLALGANEPSARCTALSHMARTYAGIGRPVEAAHYSDQAVALCSTALDNRVSADVLEAQGEVRFWSSNMAEAATSFTHARELAKEANDSDSEALNTLMLAEAINVEDRERSNRLASEALSLWSKTGDLYGVARAHMVLAFMATGEGNYGVAQCHCNDALPVFKRVTDKDSAAIVLNVMGMLARQSGDVESSLNDYSEARQDFAAAEDDLGEAESITGMADDLVTQRSYKGLLPLYSRKLALARKTGNRALLASAFVDIAGAYQLQGKYSESEKYFQRGLAEYRAAGNRYGESTAQMRFAGLRIEQGRFKPALVLLDEAQALKERTGEIEDIARIQYLRARALLALNRTAEARSEIEKTIAIIESQRLRIPKFDSRAEYFASVHQYYSFYIHVLMALHRLYPGEKYDQLAFEEAERSKVRSLLDLLQNTPPSPSCDQLLKKEPSVDSGQPEMPASAPETVSTRALTLAEIQAELADENTVLLEYALGDDQSYAWLVDRKAISSFTLAPAEKIRVLARAFRRGLVPAFAPEHETLIEYLQRRRGARIEQFERSKKLSGFLLGPLELPARKRLLIVPDGPLQYIPFAALSVESDSGDSSLLGRLHELTLLPSASVLASLRSAAAKRPPPTEGLAIFADPVFDRDRSYRQTTRSGLGSRTRELSRALQDSSGWQHIPSLPGSRSEALAIQRIVGSPNTRLALGFDATRQSVVDGSIAHNRVVHFATHGIVDTRHPEMSGLILSLVNARGELQDGYLRLSDIYNLKLTADLVVLSSCESALGKDLESEGTIGLPRGFLYAGARSVIASLWKVDDDATAILMKALYSHMLQGENPSGALHDAELELSKDERFTDPYYWAAFVVEGDYK